MGFNCKFFSVLLRSLNLPRDSLNIIYIKVTIWCNDFLPFLLRSKRSNFNGWFVYIPSDHAHACLYTEWKPKRKFSSAYDAWCTLRFLFIFIFLFIQNTCELSKQCYKVRRKGKKTSKCLSDVYRPRLVEGVTRNAAVAAAYTAHGGLVDTIIVITSWHAILSGIIKNRYFALHRIQHNTYSSGRFIKYDKRFK